MAFMGSLLINKNHESLGFSSQGWMEVKYNTDLGPWKAQKEEAVWEEGVKPPEVFTTLD